jgi:hypothetical protein
MPDNRAESGAFGAMAAYSAVVATATKAGLRRQRSIMKAFYLSRTDQGKADFLDNVAVKIGGYAVTLQMTHP